MARFRYCLIRRAATVAMELLVCALSQAAAEQRKQMPADKFVHIAAMDPAWAEHVQGVLEKGGAGP
jgi:hypothetical protein